MKERLNEFIAFEMSRSREEIEGEEEERAGQCDGRECPFL